jgi:adenylate cyclase
MAYLDIVEGRNRGQTFRLTGETPVGRAIENGISLSESEVSRQHALFRPKENYFVVIDCGSANGTFVNGRALHRFVPHPLYEGDEITVCSTKFKFVSEGQDPLAQKKSVVLNGAAAGDVSKLRGVGSLSMILTSETKTPPVSASMDASAVSAASWSYKNAAEDSREKLLSVIQRLQAMVTVSNNLTVLTNPDAVLEKIMESIFDMFPNADRAFIMLKDPLNGEMLPVLGKSRSGLENAQEDFPVSRTIINTVIEKKQSILSSDAQKDDRFSVQQSIVQLSIRSLMCAPFICKDELLGIISLDTMSNLHSFNADELAMLTSIAGQAAIAIKNSHLFVAVEKETRVRATLSRYLSRDVVEGVIDGTIPLQLGGEKKYGTVFFCDIVGFTRIAENLSAVDVVEKLNRYFAITTGIITRNRGTLHKFGGDMIMAFWNVLFPDEHAQLKAIRASVEMQSAVWKFDNELTASGQAPLYLGIGCNTGDFAGGNVGGEERMEYTVIGDNVNLAQRIESLASRWQVFVAESTYGPAASQCCAIKLPLANVKGKSVPIRIYSIRGIQCDPGKMLLTIPVVFSANAGNLSGPGMLVQYSNSDSTLFMNLPNASGLLCAGSIDLAFDLPELAEKLTISGTIKAIDSSTERTCGASIQLENLTGKEAMAFLKPGCCIESEKAWDEMKRH